MKRLAIAILLLSSLARAFHSGADFDKAPGAGGGGGIFYTGDPALRGWDCTACHQSAAGKIRIVLSSSPSSLLDDGVYQPGATYAITAKLDGEHLGFQSPNGNMNGVAVDIADAQGRGAGTTGGFAAEDLYSTGAGGTTLASSGLKPGATSWTFSWTAPAASAGPVSFYVGMVDGNAGGVGPDEVIQDPFDDDVAVGAITFDEAGARAARRTPFPIAMVALAVVILWFRRRA